MIVDKEIIKELAKKKFKSIGEAKIEEIITAYIYKLQERGPAPRGIE